MRQLTIPVRSLGVFLLASLSFAQDAPFHARMRDAYEKPGDTYSDIWGHGNYGYIGRFGTNEIDIIDISNPDALSLTRNVVIPAPNNGCSAQDIKVGLSAADPATTLAFVSFESSGPDAVGIYDVTNPSSPSLLTRVQPDPFLYTTSHNTTYRDDGWLVIVNSWSSDAAIIDLTTYNPALPPSTITSATYTISNLGTGFVHDATITENYLFLAEWDSLQVWDASDLDSGPPTYLGEVRGYSCHAVWADEDGEYVVTTDERSGGALRLWKMDDNGSSVTLRQVDSYVAPFTGGLGESYSAHNPLVFEDRIFTAYYSSGVIVHQIDRTTDTFEIVATYDTSPFGTTGYDGCWGVYPLFGYETVLASDQDEGLFTLDFSGLEFRSNTARPKWVTPFETTQVQVAIDGLGNMNLDSSTVQIFTSVDGGPFTATAATSGGLNRWNGTLPAVGCGSKIDYYFSADETGGENFTFPANAPTGYFTVYSALTPATVFADDFNTDKGWVVTSHSSLTNGAWERGTPIESGFQPGYDDDKDPGNSCFVTENGSVGGGSSDADVDGGPARLFSPTLDFSAGDGVISFTAWQACNDPDDNDGLAVSLSDDGGSSWTKAMDVLHNAGGWKRYSIRVSDFVTPTDDVKVRFTIKDNPNDTLTEAAIDNFVAESFCSANLALATFENGSGANAACFTTAPPILGQSWASTVDHSGHPGATFTMIVLFQSGASGTFGPGGEFLVNLGSLKYFTSLQTSTGSSDTHTHFIPPDVAFAGRTTTSQAAILGGVGGYELCNAYDLTVGF